jgi:hypothetical protein
MKHLLYVSASSMRSMKNAHPYAKPGSLSLSTTEMFVTANFIIVCCGGIPCASEDV